MQQTSTSRNNFCYSIHHDRSFRDDRYGSGFRVVEQIEWRNLAAAILCDVWSGIVWSRGRRKQKYFLFSDLCVFDFDSPDAPLEQAKKNFCDMRHIIGTTRSHQREKNGIVCDRYRVVIPWEKRITELREYRYNMQRFKDKYDLDKSALDGARFFYPCKKIVAGSQEGDFMSVLMTPDNFEKREVFEAYLKRFEGSKTLPPKVSSILMYGVPEGERHKSVYWVALTLAELGYSEQDALGYILQSPLIEAGEKDVRRTARDGWAKGQGNYRRYLESSSQGATRPRMAEI